MRLRVRIGEKVVSDLKVPKDQRTEVSQAIASLGNDPDQWLGPMSLSVGDVSVEGLLKKIERTKEGGEEFVTLQFWEKS